MVVETVKVVMEGGVDVLAVKDAKLAVNVAVEVSNVLVVVEVGGAAPIDVEPVVMVRVALEIAVVFAVLITVLEEIADEVLVPRALVVEMLLGIDVPMTDDKLVV